MLISMGVCRLDFFGDDNSHFAKISLVLKCYLGIPVAGELSLLRPTLGANDALLKADKICCCVSKRRH